MSPASTTSRKSAESVSLAMIDLPSEIQQAILDLLLSDGEFNNHEGSDHDSNPENQEAATESQKKAAKKAIEDETRSRAQDVLNLSCTCKFYRSLLAPHVFATIVLRNNEKTGNSVNLVPNSPYSGLVKELIYRGTWPYDFDERNNIEGIFPDIVASVLSQLHRFRNLRSLTIDFPADMFEMDKDGEMWNLWDEGETTEEVVEAERTANWRALMVQTYNALVQNEHKSLESFEIKDLMPKEVSTFNSDAFHAMLGMLKNFKLSLHGYDNGAGWCLNTLQSYNPFAQKFGVWFFDHLQLVEEFVLAADETGPLGLDDGHNWAHLALRPHQMPSLRSIHLTYIRICPELIDFIVAHLDTLEHIAMYNCHAASPRSLFESDGVAWHVLFNAICDRHPQNLKSFALKSADKITIQARYKEPSTEEAQRIQAILDQHPERKFFAYALIDDKYGMLFEEEEQVEASFLEGKDANAHEKLMTLVERNAKGEARASASQIWSQTSV